MSTETQDVCPDCGGYRSALPWAIYRRLSRKKPPPRAGERGRRRREDETIERQDVLIKAYAADKRICLCDAVDYCDPHYSAWKLKGAKRPGWVAMMRDARAGTRAGILVWKLDRFTRSPRDMEDVIDLAETHPLPLDGPGSGQLDLRTARGRAAARDAAKQAAGESDNTSERVTAALHEMMREGYPLGAGRIFGFEYAGDVEIRQSEADVLRDVAARFLAGEPLHNVASSLNSAGVTTARGYEWNGRNLARTLGHARYGGWVELKGERVARIPGEPVLDAETFEEVQARLTARRRGRRPTGKFQLTGAMSCGRCAARGRHKTLAGLRETRQQADGTRRRRYTCLHQTGGCTLSVLAEPVERIVRDRVVAELTDPDTIANIAKRNDQLADLRGAAQAEVDALLTDLTDLEVKLARREVRQPAYDAARLVYDELLAKAEAHRDAIATPEGAGQIETITAADYDLATPDRQREMIVALGLSITIMPIAPGQARNIFNPARVVIDPPEER